MPRRKRKKSECNEKQCPLIAGFKIDTFGNTMGSVTKVMESRLLGWLKIGNNIKKL